MKKLMTPIEITWKSSHVTDKERTGFEYRVMFEDIPEYAKKKWRELGQGICSDEELEHPKLEMQATLYEDGIEDISFMYYFDEYEAFGLSGQDKLAAIISFIDFVRRKDNGLPDAYNPETGECLGDGEWTELRDKHYQIVSPSRNYMYDKLKQHIGHELECVAYGDIKNPVDVCIECIECGQVLVSAEDYDQEEDISYYIGTPSSSGMKFDSKEAFLHEISNMIDNCIANGGTQFDIMVEADAKCFLEPAELHYGFPEVFKENYILALIQPDKTAFYCNPDEPDDNGNTIMVNRFLHVETDNYHAANILYEQLQNLADGTDSMDDMLYISEDTLATIEAMGVEKGMHF